MGDEVIEEGGEPPVQVGHVRMSSEMNEGDVREGADDAFSLRFEDLC